MLLKRHVKNSKYDSIANEVDPLEANRMHIHVRFSDGREGIVSIKHLVRPGNLEASTDDLYQSRYVGFAKSDRREVDAEKIEAVDAEA